MKIKYLELLELLQEIPWQSVVETASVLLLQGLGGEVPAQGTNPASCRTDKRIKRKKISQRLPGIFMSAESVIKVRICLLD